jgi:putative ABC transport system permease protein
LNQIQLWVPRPAEVPFIVPSQLNGGGYFFNVVGRLAPGVSIEQAAEAMKLTAEAYRTAYPTNVDAASRIELVPLLEDAVQGARQSYLLLFGAVGCVLLVACANISNLLLARFAARRKEIAARFVLGASRGDVIRQLLSESLSVSILGGALGLLLAQFALKGIVALGGNLIPRAEEIALDPIAIGFTVVVTLITGFAIGLLPALQASSLHVREALNESSRGSTGTGRRLRAALLVSEVALSLVLLIASGLLLTSFARLQRVEPGFQPEGVFNAQLVLPPQQYAGPALVSAYERIYERLSSLPGIKSAALTDRVPLTGGTTPAPIAVKERPVPLGDRPFANRHLVSPGYFTTLGIPMRKGRDFDTRDSATVPHVVIINEAFAKQFFPGEEPLGRTLVTGMGQRESRVVGVVADVRGQNLNTPPAADYFLPALQRPENFTNIHIRSIGDPATMAPAVREALKDIDPNLPLLQPQPLITRVQQTVADRKLALVLLGGFAGLALLLALLGVYSVMAHLVAYRTAEIGIRMALGATRGSVLRMVLSHGRRLTLVGILIGVAGALGVTRLIQQTLFEVRATEPMVYVGISLLLLLVAELACWIPARRATRIDPLTAMRTE